MSSSFFCLSKHIIDTQHIRHYDHATANGDDDVLQLCINQYTPLDNLEPQPGDVTILAAHANGIEKELYEPLWDDLLEKVKENSSFRIRNIWIADVAWQGESGVLNEQKLGNDPNWFDHSLDLLHMINYFRNDMPRPIIGIGHSMGAGQLVGLASIHPTILHSMALMEPVMQSMSQPSPGTGPAVSSTFRRDIWPSRDAAAATFRKNKFYQKWDARVFDLWMKYGLRELPTPVYPDLQVKVARGATQQAVSTLAALKQAEPLTKRPAEDKAVTLRTSKHQEVFTFQRPMYPASGKVLSSFTPTRLSHPDLLQPYGPSLTSSYRSEGIMLFMRLPHLHPSVLYIFGGKSDLSSPAMIEEKLDFTGTGIGGNGGVEVGGVKHITYEDGGHFVPFEQSRSVASNLADWMAVELARWQDERAMLNEDWSKLKNQEKYTLSEEWRWWMNEERKQNIAKRKAKL